MEDRTRVLCAALLALAGCKRIEAVTSTGDAGAPDPGEPKAHVEIGATAEPVAAPKYASPEGGYEVRFPYADVEPTLATQPIVGGVEHVAKVNGRYGTFLVGWDDTLKKVGAHPNASVLELIVGRTIKANAGKKIAEHKITLPVPFGAPHPRGRSSWDGREIEATFVAKDKSLASAHWRLYLVGTRVYQVLSLAPQGKEVPKDVLDDFFGSFALAVPDAGAPVVIKR